MTLVHVLDVIAQVEAQLGNVKEVTVIVFALFLEHANAGFHILGAFGAA